MPSSWFVLAIIVGAASVAMIAVDDDDKLMKVEGQTVGSSKTDPVVVLDGTGKGTVRCSNNDNGNNPTSSSSSSAQITFNALGHPRGAYADIIGGGLVRLYSSDIGISMEGSSGSGSIYPEGFTLQIGRAIVKCPAEGSSLTSSSTVDSNQGAAYNIGDVLIIGKCGSGVQFSAKDIVEPFQLDGTFKGDILCNKSTMQLRDICPALTGRDSDGDGIDDSCDPSPFLDLDGDGVGNERDELDNCPSVYNPDQSDRDRNHIGDVCDLHPASAKLMDPDKDFVGDQGGEMDNCPDTYNPDQMDTDHDGIGEACDPQPSTAPVYPGQQPVIQSREPQHSSPDRDHDNIPDKADNCVDKSNPDQRDLDHDKKGDDCDNAPKNPKDRDGVGDAADNCDRVANPNQGDKNRNGKGDCAILHQ